MLGAVGQVGLGHCSDGKEVGRKFNRGELTPDLWPRCGKKIPLVGGGVVNAGGAKGEVVKYSGGGSGSITVTFEDKEAIVPIVGLEFFKGVVVVVPKHKVDWGEGFEISGLVAGWFLKPAEQVGVG